MKIQCKYCGSYIDDTDAECENCGAVNENIKRMATGVPATIEELKKFCVEHNLPLAKMRFYIGENYRLPKAFGIYKDEATGDFIVYKNKADGQRAIRYQGKDEAYAVNEIYQKLKSEILNQKKQQAANNKNTNQTRQYTGYTGSTNRNYSGNRRRKKSKSTLNTLIKIIVLVVFSTTALRILASAIFIWGVGSGPSTGYYQYQDDYYYYYHNDWYRYDDTTSSWLETTIDSVMEDNLDDYYDSYGYDESKGVEDFQDSEYYTPPSSSSSSDSDWDSGSSWDSDWDSDYDWDSGSDWDSGFSDWDSDW